MLNERGGEGEEEGEEKKEEAEEERGEEEGEEGGEEGGGRKETEKDQSIYLTKDSSHMTTTTSKTITYCMYLCTPHLYIHMSIL